MNQWIASGAPRSRVKVLATILGLVLVLAALRTLIPMWSRGARTMPDELVGVWTTTAPAYRDRTLEIKPDALVFHVGAQAFRLHPVRRVVKEERGGSAEYTIYTVEYEDGSEVATLAFQYVAAPRPAIWLQNRTVAWRREEVKEKKIIP
jgi:hypothetical protein